MAEGSVRYLRLCRRGAPHFRWKKALEGMTLGSLVGLGASQVERVGETIFSRRVGWCKVSEAESKDQLAQGFMHHAKDFALPA